MRCSFLVGAGCAAMLAASSLAVVQAQPATAARCRSLLAGAPLLQGGPATAEPLGKDGCRFTAVRFGTGRFAYQVGSLDERGISFDPLEVPRQPVSVRIDARDIVFALQSGQAKIDWLNRQQQVPFDVVLAGSFDPAKRTVTLRELSLEGRAVGRTALAGIVQHVSGADTLDTAAIQSLTLHMDSRRFIAAFVLASLMGVLPDDDPGGAVDRSKAQAAAAVRALLPQAGATQQSIDAIAAFIGDFPHPQHVFDLSMTATTPVTMAMVEAASGGTAAAIALLRTLTVAATYSGDPR